MTELKNQHVPRVEKRKLVTSGNAVVLTVPKDWLEQNNLKTGQEVLMVANGNLTFMVLTSDNLNLVRNQLAHIPAGSQAILSEKLANSMKKNEENNVSHTS